MFMVFRYNVPCHIFKHGRGVTTPQSTKTKKKKLFFLFKCFIEPTGNQGRKSRKHQPTKMICVEKWQPMKSIK